MTSITYPRQPLFSDQDKLSCWECGNTLDAVDAVPVELEEDGLPLRVPMCTVCAPSEPERRAPAPALCPRCFGHSVLLGFYCDKCNGHGLVYRQVA